ncbi:hypothetical protein [Fictibacillus phosphorivorans]|uniref:hypothetical protein n=1 Tax=Fictibacillus phosphorivorans TaxID=1221500 RepID=UPI0011A490D9|nr:hypothetical protein [Fictibacillus phosphorivorans]
MLDVRVTELESKYESLQDMVSMVDEYSRHMTSQMWTMLGVFLTVLIFVLSGAAYFLIRNIVNDKVNKEIDKRLINLIKNNPPVFNASGSSIPDDKNKIHLNSNIPGIEQLIPDQVLIFEATSEKATWNSLSGGLIPILRLNENGIVEIEIPNYHENNGLVHWKILWSRIEYSNK